VPMKEETKEREKDLESYKEIGVLVVGVLRRKKKENHDCPQSILGKGFGTRGIHD